MWISIPKPTGTNYTPVNPMGMEQYDQANLSYDDSSVFYDGINPNQWTDVSKPGNIGLGSYTWNQMLMSWNEANATWDSSGGWIQIAKPQ